MKFYRGSGVGSGSEQSTVLSAMTGTWKELEKSLLNGVETLMETRLSRVKPGMCAEMVIEPSAGLMMVVPVATAVKTASGSVFFAA